MQPMTKWLSTNCKAWLSWASNKTWIGDPLGPSQASACQSPITHNGRQRHLILVLSRLNTVPTVTQGHRKIIILCTSGSEYFFVINVMRIDHMRCDSSTFANIYIGDSTLALDTNSIVAPWGSSSHYWCLRQTLGPSCSAQLMGHAWSSQTPSGLNSAAQISRRQCTASIGALLGPATQWAPTAQKRQNTANDQSIAHPQSVADQTCVSMPPCSRRVQMSGRPCAARKERAAKAWGQWASRCYQLSHEIRFPLNNRPSGSHRSLLNAVTGLTGMHTPQPITL